METAQVTFDLGWLITAVFAPVILWQFKRINDVSKDLSAYKLAASDKFASVVHLQDVEKRLVDEIKGLRDDIKELTKAMNHLAASRPTGL